MATLECIYQPPTNDQGLALIFIHGLGGDPHGTWMHDEHDQSAFWPRWLAEDCPCEAWTLGYDASFSAWRDSAMPLPRQGDAVLDCLHSEPNLAGRRLVLIGHSLGGLLIKAMIINGRTKGVTRYEELIKRICAVVFIASPHKGSHLANLAGALSVLLRTNPQVGDLSIHNPYLQTLHQQFLAYQLESRIPVRSYAEEKGVMVGEKYLGFSKIRKLVVDSDSAEAHVPGEIATPLPEDHFSICKPKNRDAQIHKSLLQFIKCVIKTESISVMVVDCQGSINIGGNITGVLVRKMPSNPPEFQPSFAIERQGRLQEKLGLLYQQYDHETRAEEKLRIKAIIEDTERELSAITQNTSSGTQVSAKSPQLQAEKIRLDVSHPEKVMVNTEFDLAVSVNQPDSPLPSIEDLPKVKSAFGTVYRPSDETVIRYRIAVTGEHCIIKPDHCIVLLHRGENTGPRFFQITCSQAGKRTLLVNAYQEDDVLAAQTRAKIDVDIGVQTATDIPASLNSSPALIVNATADNALTQARLLISYSHDSEAHRDFVRSLADRLRQDGLDCWIDQYELGASAQGWQRWMEHQIEQAHFVLLMCTPTYLKRYRGEDRDGGRGVNFEGVVISQTLYEHYYQNTKFIPLIPADGSLDNVPIPLKGFNTYRLPDQYDALYRVLTKQPEVSAPPLGSVRKLNPRP